MILIRRVFISVLSPVLLSDTNRSSSSALFQHGSGILSSSARHVSLKPEVCLQIPATLSYIGHP